MKGTINDKVIYLKHVSHTSIVTKRMKTKGHYKNERVPERSYAQAMD